MPTDDEDFYEGSGSGFGYEEDKEAENDIDEECQKKKDILKKSLTGSEPTKAAFQFYLNVGTTYLNSGKITSNYIQYVHSLFKEYVESAYCTFLIEFLVNWDFPRMAYRQITTRYNYIAHVL